jgi:DNA primase
MCYDGDGAGMRAAERNSAMFENAGCTVRVATLPAGEDPDTFIGTHGVEAFRSLLHRAPPLLEYQLEMLRTRYNLKDESARLPFVTEAARIISQSGSHLTRQEYAGKLSRILERLAEEWYPGDPHRAMQARSSLIQEVNRLLRLNRRDLAVRSAPRTPVGGGRWTPGPRREPGNTAFSPARPLASPSAKAERYVLRAALTEPRWAQWVAESTTREHFREGVHQLVVRSLLPETADMAPNEVEMPARVAQVLQNPASAEAVSALLVEETPLSDEGVGRCLMLLQREWKRGRLVQLQQELEAAPFPSDDPRRGELAELLGELGGRQYRED